MKSFFRKINKLNQGYTIIETMITVSIFIIIVMAGMGALLNANLLHQKSQDMRSILDNLSFIMEDMSRNLRTGYNYHCGASGDITIPQSCPSSSPSSPGGKFIFFKEANAKPASPQPTDHWGYKIELLINGDLNISRSTNANDILPKWMPLLNSKEIKLDNASGFTVLDAESPRTNPTTPNHKQPFVIIKLVGTINYKNTITPFSLRTSVSQRVLDR